MTAPLAEQVAAALGCTSRCYPAHGGRHSPTCIQRRERDTHAVLRVVAEWLGSEEAPQIAADALGWASGREATPVLNALSVALRGVGAPGTPAGVSQDVRDVRGAERGGER